MARGRPVRAWVVQHASDRVYRRCSAYAYIMYMAQYVDGLTMHCVSTVVLIHLIVYMVDHIFI